jgi:phosphoadenosine phosphosulfate reductase
MPLIENNLYGQINKVNIAIKRLKEFEPKDGYYLAFSGGKDSQAIYHLAKEAGVKFDAHFSITSVDPPELLHFIRANYPDVIWERPEMSMRSLILKKKMLPTRVARFCCDVLKEQGGDGRIVVMGVRWAESRARATRQMINKCQKKKAKTLFRPIIDWTDEDVWEYLNSRNIPHCSLYDEGQDRIGCVMCPLSKNMAKEAERWPVFAKMYKSCCKALIDGGMVKFKDADQMYRWWLGEVELQKDCEGQQMMFD